MTLLQLKERVDFALKRRGNEELEVRIPNNGHGMGFLSSTKVKSAAQGIDWDHNSFFLWPEKDMVEKK